ncbi:COP23 domain-containing protein [Merismopedia glauca]|uniref:Uncharacterized protein n=1 Tax=Merismopedia glauca CCAP 1448/3 TaxID=1296344 RepID=A0A2T1C2D1_9CYAN|nr:COP23 domain-containing protein [Merismopedia glauca]PSB02421.1 hypothetical protein C7B64_13350 [Merismopedia glauca CCAP 1448/3]
MNQYTKFTLALGKILGLAGLMAMTTTVLMPGTSLAKGDRFFCGTARVAGKKVPATYAFTPGQGNIPMIVWVRNDFAGSTSARQRCHAVARRFQTHYENRTLKYIRTGMVSAYPVICIANVRGGACPENQVLVTLNPGTNSSLVLSQLLDVRSRSAGRAVYLSGEDGIFYEEGEAYIDVEQLLELAPSADTESSQ